MAVDTTTQGDWFDQNGFGASTTGGSPTSSAPTAGAAKSVQQPPSQTPDLTPMNPASPAISSWAGSNTPQGVMDLWNQFINSQGYAQGPSQWSAGFGGGANQYRGNLQPLVDKFNQMTGLNAKATGPDKVDFGLGGPQDVITSAGDWWMGNVNGAPGSPSTGVGAGGFGGGGSSAGSFGSGGFGSLGNLSGAYSYTPFTLPTLAEVQATPGYQFTQQQGQQGFEHSAAAKGNLLSGQTLTDISNYNQNLANTAYQQAVNNALSQYGVNTGQQQFGANYGLAANNQAFNQGLATNQFNLGAQNQFWGQGLAENRNAFDQYNTNQNTAFNQWLSLAQLGNPGNPYA